MSLRWRCDGTLVCGAKSHPRDCDTYIDDRLHYHMSLTGVIEPDANESVNGLWHWREPRPPYWETHDNESPHEDGEGAGGHDVAAAQGASAPPGSANHEIPGEAVRYGSQGPLHPLNATGKKPEPVGNGPTVGVQPAASTNSVPAQAGGRGGIAENRGREAEALLCAPGSIPGAVNQSAMSRDAGGFCGLGPAAGGNDRPASPYNSSSPSGEGWGGGQQTPLMEDRHPDGDTGAAPDSPLSLTGGIDLPDIPDICRREA